MILLNLLVFNSIGQKYDYCSYVTFIVTTYMKDEATYAKNKIGTWDVSNLNILTLINNFVF